MRTTELGWYNMITFGDVYTTNSGHKAVQKKNGLSIKVATWELKKKSGRGELVDEPI